MKDIVWFQECCKNDIPVVGGKNANLGEMIRANIQVPPGFAITIEGYKKVIPGIKEKIDSILSTIKLDDDELLEKASRDIRHLFNSVKMPAELESTIDRYYEMLATEDYEGYPVAVRSSATAEDLPDASFAGQQDTYLWVQGKKNLKECIVKCWSSLFTSRAINYRIKKGFSHAQVLISVGVQKMVNAKVAGVIFTINPINGDQTKVVVSGSWGLGEPVVSGEVTPDEWMVDKITSEIVSHRLARKTIQHVVNLEAKKVEEQEVPAEKQDIFCLSDEEVSELARLALLLEQHYGYALDIEWAIDRDFPFPENVFIVQARPETVWSHRERSSVIKKDVDGTGYILDVLKNGIKLFK